MAKDANLHGNPQVIHTHTQVEWSIWTPPCRGLHDCKNIQTGRLWL